MPFTLFSALPTELRLKIWALALPGRRVVALNYTYAPAYCATRTSHDQAMRGCTSPTPIPSNLHVNRESRNEALLSYSLSFAIHHGRAKIFFNPDIDVIYFGPKEGYLDSFKQFADASSMIVKSEMAKVKRLAVHADLFSQSNENVSATRIRDFWEYVQRKFGNLEELVVVSKTGSGCWAGGMSEKIMLEGLTRRLERGLEFVRRGKNSKSPRWCVVPLQGEDISGLRWPEGYFSEVKPDAMCEIVTEVTHSHGFSMASWQDIL